MSTPKSDDSRSKKDYSRSKPEYRSPTKAGAALTAVPPFSFHGVTARVFPLAANISSLNSFCDSYLNMDIPKSIVHFRPLLPYVYMVVLDYGDMTVDVGTRFWVSQREVSFAVPLERYKEVDGELVFQDFALVHPFIFVDDSWSLLTGREVYGWPKVLATMEADVNSWTEDPQGRTRLLNLSTGVFPETYANQELEQRTLVEVYSEPQLSFSHFPINPTNPLNPFQALQEVITSSLSLAKNVTDFVWRPSLRGFQPTHDFGVLEQMFGQGLGLAKGVVPEVLLAQFGSEQQGVGSTDDGPSTPNMKVNNVNLKQLRDAADPSVPCFQELNYSVMGVNRVNRAGMLGDMRLIRGDLSGGFRLSIHKYASQPIVETLGLEVEGQWDKDSRKGYILKPVLPFWCDVEFYYGKGDPLCWRSPEGPAVGDPKKLTPDEKAAVEALEKDNYWKENKRGGTRVADRKPPEASEGSGPSDEEEGRDGTSGEDEDEGDEVKPLKASYVRSSAWKNLHEELDQDDDAVFNATRGASLQAVAGPFDYPDVTVRVFPLLADKKRLEKLCDEYLNRELKGADMELEPFGSYVYMTVTNYGSQQGSMWSETNNIGSWKEREVAFQVPVKWFKNLRCDKFPKCEEPGEECDEPRKQCRRKLMSVAVLTPFSFANTATHVASDREINGRMTEEAKIDSPSGTWLDESGPVAPSTLLTMSTELLPALGMGQKAVDRTLLEVVNEDVLPYNDNVGWRFVSQEWGARVASELKRKTGLFGKWRQEAQLRALRALALRFLASEAPLNQLILRQCRDSSDPTHASFQSLLLVQSKVTRVYDIREIEERLHVAIHAYPSHPIVETLGLYTKRVDAIGASVIQYLQPIRPFWMRLSAREDVAQHICRREGATWESPNLDQFDEPEPPKGGPLGALEPAALELVRALSAKIDESPQRLRERMVDVPPPGPGVVNKILRLATDAASDGNEEVELQKSESLEIEPQMVIECALSEEWENWGNPRWFQRDKRQKSPFCIPKHTIGSQEQDLFIRREELMEDVDGWLRPKGEDRRGGERRGRAEDRRGDPPQPV